MDYSGQQFDHYRIITKLGQGGMATVYKAYDMRLERDVAIKIVRKESIPPEQLERIMKRFEREAKALAKFIHPNIVPVHDFGDFQGAPFLVMSYLPGGTLKDKIGKPIPVQAALDYVIPIASALNYAHQRGVIHRDVKPSNILITEDATVMLSDFGIAQILEETTTQLTATGMGVGTPEYMAPEQWQGQATTASDQYALGVVLYELLTGQKPYSAETPLAVALKVMSEPLPRPSELVPEIPEDVEKALYKALGRDPQDRYEKMSALQNALQTIQRKNDISPPSIQLLSQEIKPQSSNLFSAIENETFDELERPKSSPKKDVDRDINRPMINLFSTHADLEIGSIIVNPIDSAEMVYVPAGSFKMGSNLFQSDMDVAHVHEVYLDAYWMYRCTVTNQQFATFLNAEGDQEKTITKWYRWHAKAARLTRTEADLWIVELGYEEHPVVNVSWYGAQAYCHWAGGRLPTEAEWEKAARGDDGRNYPWGSEEPTCDLANFYECHNGTTIVGSYPNGASPYGALDMAGNVWEWVADWYKADYYHDSSAQNPTGPASGTNRVLRGGSWRNDGRYLRASYRLRHNPDYSYDIIGFRCLSCVAPKR